MRDTKPLKVGDMVELLASEHDVPRGPCIVLADQSNGLVWFAAQAGGFAHVARRRELKVIKRKNLNTRRPVTTGRTSSSKY